MIKSMFGFCGNFKFGSSKQRTKSNKYSCPGKPTLSAVISETPKRRPSLENWGTHEKLLTYETDGGDASSCVDG